MEADSSVFNVVAYLLGVALVSTMSYLAIYFFRHREWVAIAICWGVSALSSALIVLSFGPWSHLAAYFIFLVFRGMWWMLVG